MANKEISELTPAGAITGAELVHVVQGGNSRQATTGAVTAYILIDEDDFSSNSATKAPSQQSTKAYIDAAIPAKLNASGSAPMYVPRAWVNFNGTGTVAIRASGNVSSITDNGTGDYTINFTTALQDANYSWSFGGSSPSSYSIVARADTSAPNASALRIGSFNAALGGADSAHICVQIYR